MIRKFELGIFLRVSGSRVSAKSSVKDHAVKALFKSNNLIEQSLGFAGDSHRGASIMEVFFRFRHAVIVSGISSPFVFFISFILTLSTNVD